MTDAAASLPLFADVPRRGLQVFYNMPGGEQAAAFITRVTDNDIVNLTVLPDLDRPYSVANVRRLGSFMTPESGDWTWSYSEHP
jgi:hypothetical protein